METGPLALGWFKQALLFPRTEFIQVDSRKFKTDYP